MRVERAADHGVIAEDGQLVADREDGVRSRRNRFLSCLLDQHHQNARVRLQARLGQRDPLVLLRYMIERHQRDGIRPDIIEKHDGVETVRPSDEPVRQLLQDGVAPGPYPRDPYKNEDDRHSAQRDQDAEIIIIDLTQLEGQKDVDESGDDGNIEHVPEQHRDPREPPSAPVGEKHLALLRRIPAACQKGNHLKARPLVRQAGEAKQDREQLRDDPVDQDNQRKKR